MGLDDKGENDYEEVGKLVWGLRKALLGYLVGYFGLLPPRLCSAYSVTKQPKTYDFGDQNHRFWQPPFSTEKDKNGKHLILSGLETLARIENLQPKDYKIERSPFSRGHL